MKLAYDLTPTLRAAYTLRLLAERRRRRRRHVHRAGRAADVRRRRPASRAASTTSTSGTRAEPVAAHRHDGATGISSSSAPRIASTTISSARRRRRRRRHRVRHGRARRGARRHGLGDARREGRVAPGGPVATHTLIVRRARRPLSLHNPTFNTPDWTRTATYTTVATEGDGKTRHGGALGAGRVAHLRRRSSSPSAAATRWWRGVRRLQRERHARR